MESDPDTQSQPKSLPSRAGSYRCDKMPKKNTLQTHSPSFLFFSSVSPFSASPIPSVKNRLILREVFVKTQTRYMSWKWMNEQLKK